MMEKLMTWSYPQSTDQGISLSDGNSIFVSQQTSVTDIGTGITLHGSDHHLVIHGTVAGGNGIFTWLPSGASNHDIVDISKSGDIFASATAGIFLAGASSQINNAGVIDSLADGITLFATTADSQIGDPGFSAINNTGTIHGGARGIYTPDDENINFTNDGLLTSEQIAYSGGLGSDHIVNNGQIIGVVNLADNSDFFDSRLGRVTGVISGGEGDDAIFTGAGNNTIDGGAGNDSIYGGYGADQLTGGGDNDIFLFTSTKDSTVALNGEDTITDFAHGDVLDLQSLDFNSRKAGLQSAHWIAAKEFSHTAGELQYHKTATDTYVYADTDGNGKADFAIHLDGAIKLTIDDVFL